MTPTIARRGFRFVDMNTVGALKILHLCNNLGSAIYKIYTVIYDTALPATLMETS
jgi:hypothetical protein